MLRLAPTYFEPRSTDPGGIYVIPSGIDLVAPRKRGLGIWLTLRSDLLDRSLDPSEPLAPATLKHRESETPASCERKAVPEAYQGDGEGPAGVAGVPGA